MPSSSSFPFGFPYSGSPQRVFFLHTPLLTTSSSTTPTLSISSRTTSNHLFLGLPLFLLPGTSISSVLLPTYSASLLFTCPYHCSLAPLIFSPNLAIFAVPRIYSFLILSSLVTPSAHLTIFNSATSNFPTCLSVTATVSIPYIIAGLTTHLYIFPFTLANSFLSHSTPEIFLQLSHPA